MSWRLVLADGLLVGHALVVVFNVGMLPLIGLGGLRGWRFVRNVYLRATHLVLVGFVAVQALAGAVCPLTVWEDALRRRAGAEGCYARSFVTYWVERLLYCEAEAWVFVVAYLALLGATVAAWCWIKPQRPGRPRQPTSQAGRSAA